jgi:hypothetical protein
VLACGFGFGVAVMATLLGVGEVILAQAKAPGVIGGGDVAAFGATGRVRSARFLVANVLKKGPLAGRVAAASPRMRADLYLLRDGRRVPVQARAGIPSLERALGDPETAAAGSWVDAPGDAAWASPDPASLLRSIDGFHPVPDVPARAPSWAEWLYFNGRAGDTRFYLTFLVGPRRPPGRRAAGVRLQLDRGGRLRSYAEVVDVDEARVLAEAPELTIGGSRVRLEGQRYHVTLDLPGGPGSSARVTGELYLEATPDRALPPIVIRGARGWLSGYVVPVMSGRLAGALAVGGDSVSLEAGAGYHDHNWGFWEGVTWQWGQVQRDGLSFLYGRVHPPAEAADPERVPGFLAALGPEGPIGYSSDVTIEETNDPATGRPRRIVVRGRGPSLDLTMDLGVEDAAVTAMRQGSFGAGMDFLQLRARYRVVGRAGSRSFDFEAPGSAETFRGR